MSQSVSLAAGGRPSTSSTRGSTRARHARSSSSCTKAWARWRCGETFRRGFAARLACAASCTRAPGMGSRRRAPAPNAGPSTSCIGRRRNCCLRCSRARCACTSVAFRAQRRRLDRTPVRRSVSRRARRRRGAGAASLRRGRERAEHRSRSAGVRPHRSSHAARPLSSRPGLRVLRLERHLAGSGFPRVEHRGSNASAVRCSPSRARTTNTERWRRSTVSRMRCRKRSSSSSRRAATRRTATSPIAWSTPSLHSCGPRR